ncbi:MAG: NUDIX domain-containing protein, partial [Pseudomonadota bacterium]|nr:NUDIX domain-containing protein [Pseudomonadota bacterium]
LTCLAAIEAMSYFGVKTDAELDFMFPTIRVRAAAKLAAQAESLGLSPSGFTREDAKSDLITNHYTRYFSMEEHTIRHKNYGGGETTGIKREIFVGGDAAILLPYDPVRDRVLLVEQFRMGPWARNDQNPWMLEPIAGRIDPGETAAQTALREAQEEANVAIKDLHEVAKVYASPGCNTEFFHIFLGTADLPDDVVGVAGLDSEAEDIQSHLFSFDQLMDMVESYQAANAPLVLAALWLARRRDALRAAA